MIRRVDHLHRPFTLAELCGARVCRVNACTCALHFRPFLSFLPLPLPSKFNLLIPRRRFAINSQRLSCGAIINRGNWFPNYPCLSSRERVDSLVVKLVSCSIITACRLINSSFARLIAINLLKKRFFSFLFKIRSLIIYLSNPPTALLDSLSR